MSRGFIKEGDQEEIPRVPLRAYLPEGVPNYVTKEGLAALHEELKDLETERAQVGENYIMGNFIDAKMKLLIDRINSATEVDLSKANKAIVGFGAWVRYNGRVVRIVGVDEADIDKGLISFISPIAKSLMGKKAGDTFNAKGMITIEAVSYEPMTLTQMVHNKQEHAPQIAPRRTEVLPSVELPSERLDEPAKTTAETIENPHLFKPEVDLMEFLPIVNERGNIVGRALYMELHQGNKILHPVAHLHVMNTQGVTTKRYWWHVAFGDTPEKTLQRKIKETLGLPTVNPVLKRQYVRDAKTERELVYVFTIVSEAELPKTPEGKDYTDLFAKD